MTSLLRSFWETYFRVPTILVNGVELPLRDVLNFITDGPSPPEDNETEQRTDIPLAGGLGPGGDVGAMQVHVQDGEAARFGGTGKIALSDPDDVDSEIKHTGKPQHQEDWNDFFDANGNLVARSQWGSDTTANATPTAIATVAIPSALGDGTFKVHAEILTSYASSGTKGGDLAYKATFKRSSGTLARIDIADLSISALTTGTATGGANLDVNGNEAVDLTATGISSTNITWTFSLHVQFAVVPS